MIVFSLSYALAVILFSAFVPGALIFMGAMRKAEFGLLEKIIAGFALGWILQGTLPFLEFMVAGIPFSYTLALANTAILYAIGIGLLAWSKAYEDIKLPALFADMQKSPAKFVVPAFVILLFLINFAVRIQTLSPVFQELDPYFYAYIPQQIITLGSNPPTDLTAWVPDAVSTHRGVPIKAYAEATWYALYNGGTSNYDNNILDLVANIYPPFAAAFAGFFIYLGLRAWYREEYALVASAIASFIPIFILKLTAGEAEVQPYAFFGLALFICFLLWAQRKQDLRYMALAGLGYFATALGSSSEVVALEIFALFTAMEALSMYLLRKDMLAFVKMNAVFLVFPVLAGILKFAFQGLPFTYMLASIGVVFAVAALYALQSRKFDREMEFYVLGGLAFAGLIVLLVTPVGGIVKDVALSGLQLAQFDKPLDRTIAEQGTSGNVFDSQLGFSGEVFNFLNLQMLPDFQIQGEGLAPFAVIRSIPVIGTVINWILYLAYFLLGLLAAIPSMLANLAFMLFAAALNAVFGISLDYTEKSNSMLMFLLFLSMVASAWSAYRLVNRKEDSPVWLFVALIFPIGLIGLIKAKYIIYLGFAVAVGVGFVLGELETLIIAAASAYKLGDVKKKAFDGLLTAGVVLALMQFAYQGAATATDSTGQNVTIFTSNLPLPLLQSGLSTRFQDDPATVGKKFASLCDQLKLKGADAASIASICAAGADPVGFANKSLNSQYDYNLCYLSLLKDPLTAVSDPLAQDNERVGASYRCERVSDYWIDSMEWIRHNTEPNARITSWWDYGHWENWFGQRNAVIRNEHASPDMIERVAYDYIFASPAVLKSDMAHFNSSYALFDSELLLSGSSFGGKYGALNYLACAWANQTNVSLSPGASMCEFEHMWTQVYVPTSPQPQEQCQISFTQKGVTAYAVNPVQTPSGLNYQLDPRYCMGQATLATGQNVSALYELDNRSIDGTLRLHKSFVKLDSSTQDGRWKIYTLLYTHDKVWLDNNTVTDGWEDRTGKFYDSNMYSAYVLENLPGFSLAYKTPDGAVKIYKTQ